MELQLVRIQDTSGTDRQSERGRALRAIVTYKIPVNIAEERMAHDVSKARLWMAAQTLLGLLGEEEVTDERKGEEEDVVFIMWRRTGWCGR